jgi:hypothetical protein
MMMNLENLEKPTTNAMNNAIPAAHGTQRSYLQNNQTEGIFRTARKKLQQHKNCQHIAIDRYQNVLFLLKLL